MSMEINELGALVDVVDDAQIRCGRKGSRAGTNSVCANACSNGAERAASGLSAGEPEMAALFKKIEYCFGLQAFLCAEFQASRASWPSGESARETDVSLRKNECPI